MRIRHVALIVVFLLSNLAVAQPMADRVPSDAVVYVGWKGSESLGTGYEKSHLKGVMDSSNIPQFFSEFLPRLIERMGKEDAQAAAVMRSMHGIGRVFWAKPGAIYFGGFDAAAGPGPMPKLTLVADGGNGAQAMLDSLKPMVETLNRVGVPLVASVHGKRFVTLSVGPEISAPFAALLGDASDKTAPALSTRKEFADAIKQVQKDSVVAFYVDAEAAIKLIDQIAAGENPAAQQHIANVRDAMGLAGLKQIACSGGFESSNWLMQCFIAAPAPRNGILAMLDTKPLGDEVLKIVPKSATYVGAGRFDVAKAFSAIRSLVGDLDPDAGKMVDQGLAGASAMTAVNIQTQLLEPLGDQWVVYGDPNVGGTSMMGFVLVNRLDDAKTVEMALDKLGLAIGNIISGQMRGDGMVIQMRQTKVDDLNVRYWGIPFFSVAWTIKDGNLYVALQPQIVASAAAVSGKGGSILDNPKFVAARQAIGGPNASSIGYVDLQETVTSSYPTTLAIARIGAGFADMFGVQAPAMLIPPLHKLREHLGTASSASWTDDAGWHSKSISPFPGSELFATEANMMVAQQAMAVSILLPALNAAKERANRVKCASDMRQMGQGCLLYANDHRGKYPQTLGELVTDADMNPQVFVCPSGNTDAPTPDLMRDPKKGAAWVNQNADYVYLGAAMNPNMPADRMLIYEKPENHEHQGRNVLFNDGHVEWMLEANFQKDLQRQQAAQPNR